MLKKIGLLGAGVLALSACTWVELSPGGERVELMTQQQAANCQRVGQTTSQVVDRVGFVDRSQEKQQRELVTLARNEAASMGGDAIVPAAEMADGRQRFIVYQCD